MVQNTWSSSSKYFFFVEEDLLLGHFDQRKLENRLIVSGLCNSRVLSYYLPPAVIPSATIAIGLTTETPRRLCIFKE